MRGFPPAGLARVEAIYGLPAQRSGQLFQRGGFLTAKKKSAVTVTYDGVRMVFVQRFQLALRLQHQTGGNLPASDRCHELFQVWNLANVGAFVNEAPHMHRQPPAVLIIRAFTQQVEQLAVAHGNQEVERAVRIAHDQKQRRFLFSESVQRQLVLRGEIAQFCNVERSKPRAAGNQDAFRCLARRQLKGFILPHCEMVRRVSLQVCKQQIYGVLKVLIILPHLHTAQHIQQAAEILLLRRTLIMQVSNQRGQQQTFAFVPEGVSAFSLALRVLHEYVHQFQNVLL